VFAADLAAARALAENGIEPDAAAGFSLGELAALTFAGALSDEDGFRLAVKRAELMQEAAARVPSGMAAVLGLPDARVEALCRGFTNVYPVNYNCPGQLVVAGERNALEAFCLKVAGEGGKALPLAVNGGFHSPLMAEAAKGLDAELCNYTFMKPTYPVYANLTGLPYEEPFAETLARQAESPVRWQKTIEALLAGGIDAFVEVGPGKTLCGFVKKIAPDIKAVYNVQDQSSLEATLAALKTGGVHA
jgi:[acyl-carrier-protein] S-malonyltransferase